MVSRAIATEISAGNGAGPNNDFVYLDLTHLGAETIKQKLPDITDFVRTYVKIEPINDRSQYSLLHIMQWEVYQLILMHEF